MADKSSELEIYKKKRRVKKERKESFYSGVMVLSLSAVIVKIIGLVYKIPMLKLLGSEGMGYFNCAYEIYALLCVISTAGLPVAMSVMISKGIENTKQKIFKSALKLFLILGVGGCTFMLMLSYPLARLLGSDKSFFCILAIAPTLLFICVTSAYRGYFQGLSRMVPTAVSQIIEALLKLVLGIIFAISALKAGLSVEIVATFAVLGIVAGSAVSMLYLMFIRRDSSREKVKYLPNEIKNITFELCKTAIPISLSAAVLSLTKMIDMTMILRRLQSVGYSPENAFSVYGSYTTLCLPLFSLAPALVSSVALPVIPKLSRAISDGDTKAQTDTVNDGIRITNMISMPIAAGLALFSKEILELIFKGESEAIQLCSPLLAILALSITFSSLVTLSNAVLQAYGKASVPMWSMAIGAVFKIIFAFFLIGNKDIGIIGAPISTFACDFVIIVVNFIFVSRYAPKNIKIGMFTRPFLSSIIAVGASRYLYFRSGLSQSSASTLSFIALSAFLYVFMCVIFKAVDIKEIKKLRQDRKKIKKGY